jgi:hypothetical protein
MPLPFYIAICIANAIWFTGLAVADVSGRIGLKKLPVAAA